MLRQKLSLYKIPRNFMQCPSCFTFCSKYTTNLNLIVIVFKLTVRDRNLSLRHYLQMPLGPTQTTSSVVTLPPPASSERGRNLKMNAKLLPRKRKSFSTFLYTVFLQMV